MTLFTNKKFKDAHIVWNGMKTQLRINVTFKLFHKNPQKFNFFFSISKSISIAWIKTPLILRTKFVIRELYYICKSEIFILNVRSSAAENFEQIKKNDAWQSHRRYFFEIKILRRNYCLGFSFLREENIKVVRQPLPFGWRDGMKNENANKIRDLKDKYEISETKAYSLSCPGTGGWSSD